MQLLKQYYGSCIFLICLQKVTTSINWKRVECNAVDKTVVSIRYCYVKPLKRDISALDVYINLLKIPISASDHPAVNFQLKKRANGWKPFLYNMTVNFCEFLDTRTRNPVSKYFYEFSGLKTHSTVNHSCPFDEHYAIIRNHTFTTVEKTLKLLPLPSGQYGLFTTWKIAGVDRLTVNGIFDVKE